jgi:sugar-phosphatase
MDGLLVDSEQYWLEGEIEILGPLGVPLATTSVRETKGMFVHEVTRYWFERHPWRGPGPEDIADRVLERVGQLVVAKAQVLPGARAAIAACRDRGYPLAVASSSPYQFIRTVLGHFDLETSFDVVHSAEDEPFGKPHPGVFITAAQKLGVEPSRCLVFEDAPAGVLAAKAARMTCVAVPHREDRDAPAMAVADLVLDSLEQLDDSAFDQLCPVT